MRFSTIVGIFALMLTLVPGLVFAEKVIDDSKEPSGRFVLRATSGSLKGDTLTLNGVPDVIYFSNREGKSVMSLSMFIESWNLWMRCVYFQTHSYERTKAVATLSLLKKKGAKNVVVDMKLKGVEWNQVNGALVFIVAEREELPKLWGGGARRRSAKHKYKLHP